MQEYDVNVLAADNGFTLSVHPAGSTGSAPYRFFSSWSELRSFLQSLDVSNELVQQLDEMGGRLKPGSMFNERMFLSEGIKERLTP